MAEDKKLNPEDLENVAGGSFFSGGGSGYDVYCSNCGTIMTPAPEAGKGAYICPKCSKKELFTTDINDPGLGDAT